MLTLDYPPLVPPAVQKRLTRELTRAFPPAYQMFFAGGFDMHGHRVQPHPSVAQVPLAALALKAAADLKGLYHMVDLVIELLAPVAVREAWSAVDLRTTVNRLVDQLVDHVFPDQPVTVIRAELEAIHARASWTQLQTTASTLTAPTARRLRRSPDVAHRKWARERAVVPLLEELEWTRSGWATKAGLNPSVTLDYLAGTSTLRDTSRTRLTNVLIKALGRPVRLPD